MAGWEFDRVFSVSATVNMTGTNMFNATVFDGCYLWFLSGTQLKGIMHWDQDLSVVTDKLTESKVNNFVVSKTIELGVTCKTLTLENDHIVCSDMDTKLVVVNLRTFTVVSSFTASHNCEPLLYNNKIWTVNKQPTTDTGLDKQFMYSFSLDGTQLTRVEVAFRKQKQPRRMIGVNNYVWVLSFNDLMLLKYDADTALYVTGIYINKDPEFIWKTYDGKMMVRSRNSMLSIIDPVTHQVDHLYGTPGDCIHAVDTQAYIWAVVSSDGAFLRMLKSDKSCFYTEASATTGLNYKFQKAGTDYTLGTVKRVMILDGQRNDRLNVTIPTFLVFVEAAKIHFIKLEDYLVWIGSSFTVGQYTALASGSTGFKDDA